VAEAVMLAGSLGARSASLAGMIPSLTGYGFAVARRLTGRPAPELTTGHATTVASVVKSVAGALEATGQTFAKSNIAFVGLGSIGQSTLELLIDRFPHPRRLILCDVAGSAPRLAELSTLLRARGFSGAIDIVDATPLAPDAVYEASVIVGATSAPSVVDIDRLRPGTILVDDSFPPCFDPARAIARMQTSRDVLVIGGGALSIGPTRRTVYIPPAGAAFRDRIADRLPRGEIASCQLESLLRAADPSLPVTRGLVTLDGARAYYDAVERAGYSAGAWQLGDVPIDRSIAHGLRGFQAGRGSPDEPM
jgi:predicted amino acid dehydrogenase